VQRVLDGVNLSMRFGKIVKQEKPYSCDHFEKINSLENYFSLIWMYHALQASPPWHVACVVGACFKNKVDVR
jgi:hypothetical protein